MRSSRLARALVGVAVTTTMLYLRAAQAFADPYPGGSPPPPVVKGKTFFGGNENPADTGNNVLLLLLLAALALVIGLWLRQRSRRRAEHSES